MEEKKKEMSNGKGKLIEYDERFKTIFMESPIAITLYDSEGKLIDANKACLDLINVSNVEDIKGFDIFTDPNLSKDKKEKLLKGETVRFEIVYNFDKVKESLKADKSGILYINAIISPIYYKSKGSVSYYLNQVQDITNLKLSEKKLKESKENLKKLNIELEQRVKERSKKLKESEEKYRTLFKSSIEGVLISDNEGKFSSVNPAAASLLGYDGPEEMIGMLASNIYIDHSRREPIIKGMKETGYLKDFEIQLKKKDGTPIDTIFNVTLHKDEDGNLLRIEAFFRDITERKKADEKILNEKNKAQSYLDLAGVLIIALNKEGNITLIN